MRTVKEVLDINGTPLRIGQEVLITNFPGKNRNELYATPAMHACIGRRAIIRGVDDTSSEAYVTLSCLGNCVWRGCWLNGSIGLKQLVARYRATSG